MDLYNMQNIRFFHWIILEIWLIENLAIWLADNILAHTSETKIFPSVECVQEHSKYKFSSQKQIRKMTKWAH